MSDTLHSFSPLGPVGAALTHRDQRAVVAHYGSAAGELAACHRSVGIALRTDLIARTLTTDGRYRSSGWESLELLAAGGIAFTREGWYCVAPEDSRATTVVGRPSAPIFELVETERETRHWSEDAGIYNVLGPRASELLADLGLLGPAGDARQVQPFAEASLGGRPIRLISQTLTNFLLLVQREDLETVWRVLVDTGRSRAAAAVGIEAVERYQLGERRRVRLLEAI